MKNLVEGINNTGSREKKSESSLITSPDKKETFRGSNVFSPHIEHLALFLLNENITMINAFFRGGGTIPVDNFTKDLTEINYNVEKESLDGLIHDM